MEVGTESSSGLSRLIRRRGLIRRFSSNRKAEKEQKRGQIFLQYYLTSLLNHNQAVRV